MTKQWGQLDGGVPEYRMEITALAHAKDTDSERTLFAAGKQFAVRHPDGKIEIYTDQNWLASGDALREFPGATIVQRGVRVEYTDWEDFPLHDPLRVDRVAHAALLEYTRLNTKVGSTPSVHWDEQLASTKDQWRAIARAALDKLELLDSENNAGHKLRLLPCSVYPGNRKHPAHAWMVGSGDQQGEWHWCVGEEKS